MNGEIEAGLEAAIRTVEGFEDVEIILGCFGGAPAGGAKWIEIAAEEADVVTDGLFRGQIQIGLNTPADPGDTGAEAQHRADSETLLNFLLDRAALKTAFASDAVTLIGSSVTSTTEASADGVWQFFVALSAGIEPAS